MQKMWPYQCHSRVNKLVYAYTADWIPNCWYVCLRLLITLQHAMHVQQQQQHTDNNNARPRIKHYQY